MDTQSNFRHWLQSPIGIILLISLGIVTALLVIDHSNHFLRLLPYAFLLLCPLMHVFMHNGHEHEQSEKRKNDAEETTDYTQGSCH
jgi:hypothetical protein